jgi:hypothetical protein
VQPPAPLEAHKERYVDFGSDIKLLYRGRNPNKSGHSHCQRQVTLNIRYIAHVGWLDEEAYRHSGRVEITRVNGSGVRLTQRSQPYLNGR